MGDTLDIDLSQDLSRQEKKNKKGKVLWKGDYRQFGMIKAPSTVSQFELVMAAKNFVEGLKCYDDVRRLLAAGRSGMDVGRLIIEEKNEAHGRSVGSVMKYATVYRTFFIPDLEQIAAAPPPIEHIPPEVQQRITKAFTFSNNYLEVDVLEQLLTVQLERCLETRQFEKDHLGGLHMPRAEAEIASAQALAVAIQNMKSDLGVPKYGRVPMGVNLNLSQSHELEPFKSLTDGERVQVLNTVNEAFKLLQGENV